MKTYGDMYNDDKYSRLRVQKACQVAYQKWLKQFFMGKLIVCPEVLDIGCYTMEVKRHLPNYCAYTGIDMHEQGKDIITMDLNNYERGDMPDFYYWNKQFDLIFALEIIEHLLYPDRILKACQSVLNKDGVICFSLPNENTLYQRIVMALGLGCDAQAFKPYKHLHFGTIRQQRAFLKGYFRIVAEYSYISTDMHKSRGEWIGKFAKKIPDQFWQWIADVWPGLFARGRIYVCKAKN